MNIDNKTLTEWLVNNEACEPALERLGDRDLATAWQECPEGEWLDWVLQTAGLDVTEVSSARAALRAARTRAEDDHDRKLRAAQVDYAAARAATASVHTDVHHSSPESRAQAEAIMEDACEVRAASWVAARKVRARAYETARADFADAIRAVYPEPPAELVAAILEAS